MNKELQKRVLEKKVEDKHNELYGDMLNRIDEYTKTAGLDESDVDGLKNLAGVVLSLLELDEDEFKIIAPEILSTFADQMNEAALIQRVRDTLTAEDVPVIMEGMVSMFNDLKETVPGVKKEFFAGVIVIISNFFKRVLGQYDNVSIYTQMEVGEDEVMVKPKYAHIGDSGLDIYSPRDYDIAPGETVLIKTGIKMNIPQGYEVQIRDKSGIALKTKIRVANSPSTIDSNYRGEIGVILENIESPITKLEVEPIEVDGKTIYSVSNLEYGKTHHVEKGTKVAQMVVCRVATAELVEVDEVEDSTNRGDGGFGSTGLK